MLEKTPDDADHSDAIADAFESWPEAAHAPHHQFDGHPSLGGFVEQGDDCRVDQGIDLGPNMAPPAGLGVVDFTPDQAFHAAAQGDGCDQ